MPCGLFIVKNNRFLGVSPDRIVDKNRIVEIKCPLSGYRDSLQEATQNKNITFWKNVKGQLVINMGGTFKYKIN